MFKKIGRRIIIYRIRLKVSLRDFGLFHTLSKGVSDVLLANIVLFRRYIIYEKQLSPAAAAEIRNPDIKLLFLSAKDTDLIVQIENLSGISREFITEKISQNGQCIVALNKDTMVGFNLVSVGKTLVRYLGVHLNLSATEAWSEQITVSKEFRRGGLASDLRHMMFAHLAAGGYQKLIGGYVPFNIKSGLLAKKLGFVETEKITLIKIFGWKKLSRQSLIADKTPSLALSVRR